MMSDNNEFNMSSVSQAEDGSRVSDRFSWGRVLMTAHYWWPRLRWQYLTYIILGVVCSAACAFIDLSLDSLGGAQFFGILCYLMYLGPSVFGLHNGREFDVTLPVRNSEKTVFYLLYSLVAIPLPFFLGNFIYTLITGESFKVNVIMRMTDSVANAPGLKGFLDSLLSMAPLVNVICTLCLCSICLYCAIFIKRNAFVKSILATLGALWIPSLGAGFFFGAYAFEIGYRAAVENSVPDTAMIMEELVPMLNIITVGLGVVSLLTAVVLICLFIRNYPKREV